MTWPAAGGEGLKAGSVQQRRFITVIFGGKVYGKIERYQKRREEKARENSQRKKGSQKAEKSRKGIAGLK
jgi:hypothetical protein